MLKLLYEGYHFSKVGDTIHVSHNHSAVFSGSTIPIDFAFFALCATKNSGGHDAFLPERALPREQICIHCRRQLSLLVPLLYFCGA